MTEQPNLSDYTSSSTPFFGLLNLALIVLAFWNSIDPNNQIYTVVLTLTVLSSIKILIDSRKNEIPISSAAIVFFILIWLGITGFSDPTTPVDLVYLQLTLIQVNCILLLPLVVVWFVPYNRDNFFGMKEVPEKLWIKSIWKISIMLILILKIIDLSGFYEIVVLLPLIVEPVRLYSNKKGELPLLTLHITQELSNTFAVPISMLKGIFVIMTAFIFELLDGNLWLLVILLYMAAGFIWFLDFIIPEGMKQNTGSKFSEEDLKKMEEKMSGAFNLNMRTSTQTVKSEEEIPKKPRRRSVNRKEEQDIVPDKEKEQTEHVEIEMDKIKTTFGKTELDENVSKPIELREDATIGEKAHALGRRVRTELQKPQYNLNHILSTLSKEDFTSAFRVPKDNLIFDSKEGNWSPPKDLILFPIQLEEYDYRRVGEILLLGFNRPIEGKMAKTQINFGDSSVYNMKIAGNQIQIGDTTFHMKTLVLTSEQWEQAQKSLEIVDDVEDISYTGFNTLHDLQEKLTTISEKWIEMRKKAEEAVINFMAGLLGSKDPIFLGKDEIQELLESENNYEILDE